MMKKKDKKDSFETLSKKGFFLNFKGFHQKMQKRRKKDNVWSTPQHSKKVLLTCVCAI